MKRANMPLLLSEHAAYHDLLRQLSRLMRDHRATVQAGERSQGDCPGQPPVHNTHSTTINNELGPCVHQYHTTTPAQSVSPTVSENQAHPATMAA